LLGTNKAFFTFESDALHNINLQWAVELAYTENGVIDISPYGLKGSVSETIYPKVTCDYGGIPVRGLA
jgi:hypothetical protein